MGYRRSPARVAAERDWKSFVEANAALVEAAGLPPAATDSIRAWGDLLTHGYLPADPGAFTIDQLSPTAYQSLVALTCNYFRAGYEFYSPTGLAAEDQAALRSQFGSEP